MYHIAIRPALHLLTPVRPLGQMVAFTIVYTAIDPPAMVEMVVI